LGTYEIEIGTQLMTVQISSREGEKMGLFNKVPEKEGI